MCENIYGMVPEILKDKLVAELVQREVEIRFSDCVNKEVGHPIYDVRCSEEIQ